MTYLRFSTYHLPCEANSVTIFGDRGDAETCATGVRAGLKKDGVRRSVRIIERNIRVASVRLSVFCVVISGTEVAA